MKNTALIFLAAVTLSPAIDLYVSPSGSDDNSGTQTAPLATIQAAKSKAAPFLRKEAVNIILTDGTHYLPSTITFTRQDSGTAQFPFTIKAENEGQAILSGGSLLNLEWSEYQDGIFQAQTPDGLNIDQLFINNESQRMARYPNYDAKAKTKAYQGYAADAFSKERAAKWQNPAGGYIHAMHTYKWGGYHYLITGKDTEGNITYEGGWQNNRQLGMHKDQRMVENIFEELDAPQEWFHNAETNTLYFKPVADTDLKSAKVEVVRLANLFEFQGSEKEFIQHITIKGLTVRHTARTFMENKEPLVRSDWTISRSGAFLLTGTHHVSILDCEFDQVGGNAIFVNNYNRHTVVKGCHIHHTGASGVCFVGDPDALRSPLFEYAERQDLKDLDRTKGPKTMNFPMDCEVSDCLITNIGTVERQPAGVQIAMCAKITVQDCSIYDCARAGINIGDGAFGGHMIDRVDVFDTVLETHDHGSFNSWGRDRYWGIKPNTKQILAENPELPFLDAIYTTTIRNSRWRCDHGWDIDLDDGSTNYDIYNNVMLGQGIKLREGFRRHVWNNICPTGKLHPHVWYDRSTDQVYANIFSTGHAPAHMDRPYVDETMVDKNLFTHDPYAASRAKVQGWDQHSLTGDALYTDAAKGDYSVKPDSPALKVGFKNFPMDQFGVKKPSLKAIARTPILPNMSQNFATKAQPAPPAKRNWIGATFQELRDNEFSAYGVSMENPGLAIVSMNEKSIASDIGLQKGDVLLEINGVPMNKAKKLFSYQSTLRALKTGESTFTYVRSQARLELKAPNNLLN